MTIKFEKSYNRWQRVTTWQNMTHNRLWLPCISRMPCKIHQNVGRKSVAILFAKIFIFYLFTRFSGEFQQERKLLFASQSHICSLSRERLRVHKIYKFCKKNPNQKVNVEVIWYFLRHFCLLESYLPKSNLKLSNKIMRNI